MYFFSHKKIHAKLIPTFYNQSPGTMKPNRNQDLLEEHDDMENLSAIEN